MAWISVAALTILIEPLLQFSSVPTSKCHNVSFPILSNSLFANHLDISMHIFWDTNSAISKHINTPSPFKGYNKWTTNTCMYWDHLATCNGSKPVSFTTQHICNNSSKHGEIPAGLCKASRPHVCTIKAVLECDTCQLSGLLHRAGDYWMSESFLLGNKYSFAVVLLRTYVLSKTCCQRFCTKVLHHQCIQRTTYRTVVKYRITGSKLEKNKTLNLVLFFDDAWFRWSMIINSQNKKLVIWKYPHGL